MSNDEGRKASERFRPPANFSASIDPVEGNPFSETDTRYQVWSKATLAAEEEVYRLPLQRPLTEHNARTWARDLTVAKFDAWAYRTLCVVWTNVDLHAYDNWLVNYANSWMDAEAMFYADNPPPWLVDELLLELRNALGLRVQYWKAEGRKYLQQTRDSIEKMKSAAATVRAAARVPRRNNQVDTVNGKRVADFLSRVESETGRRFPQAAIWKVIGYKDRSLFQRFKHGRATQSATEAIERILSMSPREFVAEVDRLQKR